MSYTVEQKEGNAIVSITLPWSDLSAPYETAVEKAVAHSKENTQVKGFRKGHVPDDIVEGQVNRMEILSHVVDDGVREDFTAAIKEEKLKVAGNPQVSVKKMAEGNDVEIELTVALIPEVELPKEWEKIVKKVNEEKSGEDSAISDKDIDQEVERLADSRTKSDVVERAAKDGDQVKIDFDVKQDGVVIEGGTSKDYALILGKGAFIPGFEEEVIGMSAGDEKSFTLSFPEKYHAEHLAGKDATFDVVLHAVEERVTPTADDAFAESLGGTFKTLAELKDNIREGMESEKKRTAEEAHKSAFLESLADASDVVVPDALLQEEVARMSQEMEGQIAQSGMSFDDYLTQMNKTREDLAEMWQPQARKRIVSALLLEKLGDHYDIEVSKEDIEAEMNKTMAMYKGMEGMEDKIDPAQLYDYTKGILRNGAVFEAMMKL